MNCRCCWFFVIYITRYMFITPYPHDQLHIDKFEDISMLECGRSSPALRRRTAVRLNTSSFQACFHLLSNFPGAFFRETHLFGNCHTVVDGGIALAVYRGGMLTAQTIGW